MSHPSLNLSAMKVRTDARECSKCARFLPAEGFYTCCATNICIQCRRSQMRARYQAKRDAVDAHKLSVGCVDCGYKAHPAALHFDHVVQARKRAEIALMVTSGQSMAEIMAEIAKCEVVCANCHAIRTHSRGYPGSGPKYKR